MTVGLGGSFCGYGATQVWQDFWLWEHLLNGHPGLCAIVELGTAYGGFALYLATQAEHRGMAFRTFDSIDHARAPLDQLFGRPDVRPPAAPIAEWFEVAELWQRGAHPSVVAAISDGPVALFCDNGNKVEEVRLYAPLLALGSLLVVHDWGTEIRGNDINPHLLRERYGEVCDQIGSWSRVFERVAGIS